MKNRQYHLLSVLGVLTLWALYGTSVQMPEVHDAVGFYEYHFTPNSFYQLNGFAVSFISNMQYLDVSKPADYSVKKVEEIMEPYAEEGEKKEVGGADLVYPNIIVVMNEAFSDPAVLGDFETNVDYMPYIRSMTENTVKGNLMVSVKGGNTANTEYEFLTGNSMAFLPAGSIPYQQYIRGEMPSVASQLGNVGYETFAIHPYRAMAGTGIRFMSILVLIRVILEKAFPRHRLSGNIQAIWAPIRKLWIFIILRSRDSRCLYLM